MATEPTEELVYHVLSATGKKKDELLKPRRVNKAIQNGKGWISLPNCEFPIEIILKFETTSEIKKMQILAHHQLIPSSIDFYYAIEDDDILEFLSLEDLDFESLGCANFRENDTTDYTARELKTIFLDVEALFVKLVINRNHKNKFNPDNQIGIMDLDFVGIPMGETKKKKKPNKHLIYHDTQRRVSRVETARRLGTAQARKILQKNYAQESFKLLELLEKKLKEAQKKKEKSSKLTELQDAVDRIKQVHDEAELLLKEQKQAFGQKDEEFAEACDEFMREHVKEAYQDIDVFNLLSQKEVDELGLKAARTKGRSPMVGKKNRSISQVNREARRESISSDLSSTVGATSRSKSVVNENRNSRNTSASSSKGKDREERSAKRTNRRSKSDSEQQRLKTSGTEERLGSSMGKPSNRRKK